MTETTETSERHIQGCGHYNAAWCAGSGAAPPCSCTPDEYSTCAARTCPNSCDWEDEGDY